MSWLISFGILTLIGWSFSIKVSLIDRLRPYVIFSQMVLLVFYQIYSYGIIVHDHFLLSSSMIVFFCFCFPYQRICMKQDNYTVRFAMLMAILTGGIALAFIFKPLDFLPLVYSAAIFHLYQNHIAAYLKKQSLEVKALKEHVISLKGQVSRKRFIHESEVSYEENQAS